MNERIYTWIIIIEIILWWNNAVGYIENVTLTWDIYFKLVILNYISKLTLCICKWLNNKYIYNMFVKNTVYVTFTHTTV